MGQQTKSTKSKPRKRRNDGGNRVVFIIAAVLMVIYLGGRLSNAFSAAPVNAYSRTHRWRSSILIRNLWI